MENKRQLRNTLCPPSAYRALQAVQIVYFFGNQLLLFAVSRGMELDLAEQVWLADRYTWVYGSQPPLYTWISKALLTVSGGSLLPLYLFKAMLLSVIVGSLLSIGRRAGFTTFQMIGTLAGAFLTMGLAWEAQRDLTHTVLATALAAWILRDGAMACPGGWRVALRTGLLSGLGVLAKYNFLLFAVSWYWTRAHPGRLSAPFDRRRWLVGLLLAVCLIAPYLHAINHAGDLVFESTDKFELGESTRWQGLLDAGGAILISLAPLAALGAVIALRRRPVREAGEETNPVSAMLVRLLQLSIVITLALTLISGASEVRERWLIPLFFYSPVLFAHLLPRAPDRVASGFVLAGLAAGLLISIFLPARVVWADALGSHNRLNLPYRELMHQIAAEAGRPTFVIVDGVLPAGHARLAFPDAEIFVYNRANPAPAPRGDGLVIGRMDAGSFDHFREWLERMDIELTDVRQIQHSLYYSTQKAAGVWWSPVRLNTPVHFAD